MVVVTLDRNNDRLGWDVVTDQAGKAPSAPVQRSAPVRRSAPLPSARPQRQALINNKVEKLEATVAQQQKQIATLTAQLKEQAAQIQKVSARVEMNAPATKVANNR